MDSLHTLCSLLGLSCLLKVTKNPEVPSAKETPFPLNVVVCFWLVPSFTMAITTMTS